MSTGLDPFVDGSGGPSYYATATLKQRIDLVRHLIGFGRQIVVLTGPPGSGKSSLLEQIIDDDEARWHVLRLRAGPTLNGEALLQRLGEDLELDSAGDELSMLNTIREWVASANERGVTTVVAIDDADALPADTAGCLAALAHAANPDAELKVVLTADAEHSAIIEQLQVETQQHALLHVVEVPRLSDEQTRQMLQHRWAAAYGEESFPFSDVEMAQIYQQAAGLPGKAIVLARQVQIMSGGPAATERDPARRFMIAGAAAIVLLGLVAFLNHESPDETEPALVELDLPGDVVTPMQPDIEPVTEPVAESAVLPLPRPEPPPDPAPAATNKPSAPPLPAASVTVQLPPVPAAPPPSRDEPATTPAAASAEPVSPQTPMPKPAAKPEPGPDPAPDPTPTSTSPPAPAPKPAAPEATAPKPPAPKPPAPERTAPKPPAKPAYTLSWLKSRPDTGYVLQLFGVRDRAAAERFVRSRNIAAKSAVLATRHAGQPWYVVLYGHYPDRSAAQAAIGDLPANLAGTSPWARPLKSLE